jgi:hypothetical protein
MIEYRSDLFIVRVQDQLFYDIKILLAKEKLFGTLIMTRLFDGKKIKQHIKKRKEYK